MSEKPSPKRRIFFALWPDPLLRDELTSLLWPVLTEQVKQTTAKRVPAHNWHITLAFVGNVSPQTVDDMQQQVDALEPPPAFNLKLDTFGLFQ